MKKMYYVYLLQSSKTGLFYLGWTTDINRRLCYKAYSHRDKAVAREKTLKRCPNMLKQIRKRLFRTLKPASSAFKEVVG